MQSVSTWTRSWARSWSHAWASAAWLGAVFALCALAGATRAASECSPGAGQGLKYLWGDAMNDPLNCVGPRGQPYPSAAIARSWGRGGSFWSSSSSIGMSSRMGRASNSIDPWVTQKALLRHYELNNQDVAPPQQHSGRSARSGFSSRDQCPGAATRLCKTRYNTTAPMYGVSLTSGQPVTIVQKFPDLLQQVVFEVCESSECDVVRGECTQTYVPYLFLVIPLGPVTLTGQDYVLVESGCVCRPKGSSATSENHAPPPPPAVIPGA